MRAWIAAVAMATAVMSEGAAASDGNELMRNCQSAIKFDDTGNLNEPFRTGSCFGVVSGVMGSLAMLNPWLPNEHKICFPENGVTNGQAARIVVKLMKDYPEQMSADEVVLITLALKFAFPCKT